jgi:hypothetical protein
VNTAVYRVASVVLLLTALAPVQAAQFDIDETPAVEGEWGFRPADGATSALNPPRFCWRPQKNAKSYIVEAARDREFSNVAYRGENIVFNVHAPPKLFDAGKWFWRFRVIDTGGNESSWSSVRAFELPSTATKFPLPPRDELLKRIPTLHPRLFVRPEEVAKLRDRAKTDLKPQYDRLIKSADALLKRKTPTNEPAALP